MNARHFTGDLRGRDFSGQNLAGAVFVEADLCRASFAGANLEGAEFRDCLSAEATFTHARCAAFQALNTNFYRSNFRRADLTKALLGNCVLAGADLRGARLRGITVTLDCNSFEDVLLDYGTSTELAYLFTRARSAHRRQWLNKLGEQECQRLERVFVR